MPVPSLILSFPSLSPGAPVDLDLLSIPEVGEGGVALDLVGLADGAGLGAVQLGDLDVLRVGEVGGELVPGGGEFLEKGKERKKWIKTAISRLLIDLYLKIEYSI